MLALFQKGVIEKVMKDIKNIFGRIHSIETFGTVDGPRN